jgi:isoleucyl-tRNA synthetase
VADAWFDSGSMPVAQWHYPFENQEIFAIANEADYISEAIDQTRGWFYTLHAVSTLMFDHKAFKNCICLGHILDINGEKMSKSKGNVVNPWDLLNDFGADATRWYMYSSAPPYNPRRFSMDQVGEIVRRTLLTLWNTYAFFVTYANVDGWQPPQGDDPFARVDPQLIDKWALARLHALTRDVTAMLENYDIYGPTKEIESFIDELSNWYVRRNRRRFWKAEDDADKQAAYLTLYTCLTVVARLIAPFMPYISEELYRNLVLEQFASMPESVHLTPYPVADEEQIDEQLIKDTALLMETVSLARAARRAAGMRVRQPLSELLVRLPNQTDGLHRYEDELRDELNVKRVRFIAAGDDLVEHRFMPNLSVVGRKYRQRVPAIKNALTSLQGEEAAAAARSLEAGHPIAVQVDGESVQLEPDEVLITTTSPQGFEVAEENGVLVALNTTLTPDLVLEGQARDLVRFIQDIRKSAGCEITDRIAVTLQPLNGQDLAQLLFTFGDYVQAETLATSLQLGSPEDGAYTTEIEMGDGSVLVGLRRAAT